MQETPSLDETRNSPDQTLVPNQNNSSTPEVSKKYSPMIIFLAFVLVAIVAGWVGYLIGFNHAENNLENIADDSNTEIVKHEVSSSPQSSPTLQPDPAVLLTATYQDPANIFEISYPDDIIIQCDYDNDGGNIQFWQKPYSCENGTDIIPRIVIKKTSGMTLDLEREPDEISELTINDMVVEKRVYVYQLDDGPLYQVGSKTELLFYIPDTDQYISLSVVGNDSDDIDLLMSMAESFKFTK